MAKADQYMEEACRELERLSADERTKLEYEARERAIRDYNSQMNSSLKRGMKQGLEKGIEYTLQNLIQKKLAKGKTPAEIADDLEDTEEHIRELIRKMEGRTLEEELDMISKEVSSL